MAAVFGAGGHLPEGAVLLHIGPHKTGTTAIQGSLAAARRELRRAGIFYPGGQSQQRMPALAAAGRTGPAGHPAPAATAFDKLAATVRKRSDRVMLSGEAFTEADDERARAIVAALGGERVHIVVTLRPLAKILASAWQQAVRSRSQLTYDEWLDAVFGRSGREVPSNFWHRHQHDELIERWLSIVGPERVAVVVASDVDRMALLRSFETLLDLPAGFLKPEETAENRGLTAQEIELVRLLNVEFHSRGWPWELFHEVVRRGSIRRMQQRPPGSDEPKIHTPAWAVERANQVAAEATKRIAGFGITVLGDLDSLSVVTPAEPPTTESTEPVIVAAAAREAIAGAKDMAAGLQSRNPVAEAQDRPLAAVGTPELVRIVAGRVRSKVFAARRD